MRAREQQRWIMIMKKIILISFAISLLTSYCYAENLNGYLDETQTIVKQGKYKAALERYLWFHNHSLEHDQALYGVRISAGLSYWKELGDIYPPAMTALLETRNRKIVILKTKNANYFLFHDLAAINELIQQETNTIKMFEYLAKNNPPLAKQCWLIAKKDVVNQKRFDIAKNFLTKPIEEFNNILFMWSLGNIAVNEKNTKDPKLKGFIENNFVEETLCLIQVALALGFYDEAKEIQQRAYAITNDCRIKNSIPNKQK